MDDLPAWTWNIPEHFNIGVACTDAHIGTPVEQRVAMIVDNDVAGDRQVTFAELATQTSQFAQLLRDLGVNAADRVLIRLPNCIQFPTVFLGALKRGAVPVPTSALLTAEEVAYLVTDAGASVLVTDRAAWNTMHAAFEPLASLTHVLLTGAGATAPAARLRVLDLEPALASIRRWQPPEPTRAEDAAYLVYTSGTTGYAKGVLHAHRALLGRQPSSTYWFDFRPEGDRVLHSGHFNWTYVLGTGMMDPLYRGHTAILHEGTREAAIWPRLVAKHDATIFIGVPTLYRQVIQHTPFGRTHVPSLRHCMCAGEHLSAEVLAAWRQRFGLDIYEGLGMSECSYYLCQMKSRPIRPRSCGFAQPGHDVRLLDPDTCQEVPPGAEGMLCIPRHDPGLMLRYWNQPEETARCFDADWFLTGDYFRRDADGYFWFLGRKDDLINTFGYRVSPHEIERVLKEHPDVVDAAVAGEEIAANKTLVTAYVILHAASARSPDELLAYGRQRLAAYKAPRIVYLVDDLPRTRNGKIQRRALSSRAARARSTPSTGS